MFIIKLSLKDYFELNFKWQWNWGSETAPFIDKGGRLKSFYSARKAIDLEPWKFRIDHKFLVKDGTGIDDEKAHKSMMKNCLTHNVLFISFTCVASDLCRWMSEGVWVTEGAPPFQVKKKNADLLCEWNSYVDEVTAGREFLASIFSDQNGPNNRSPLWAAKLSLLAWSSLLFLSTACSTNYTTAK